jgi:hypothetical protein
MTANVFNLKTAEWNMAWLEQECTFSAHKSGCFDFISWRYGYKWILDANGNILYQ